MASHGVRLGVNGQLQVTRSAPPEDVDRLRATLARLRAAAGAGAVEVVEVTDEGSSLELVLAFAGRPLSAPMAAGELAHVGAAVAAALGDLHGRGLVHGAVRAEHVLVDSERAVRLCGFGQQDDAAVPSDDVHALGALLRDLLDPNDTSDAARELAGIADRCCSEDARSRPSIAAVATSLASVGHVQRSIVRKRPAPASRSRAPLALIPLAIVAVLGASVMWSRVSDAHEGAVRHVPTTARITTTITSTTIVGRRVWPDAPPHVIEADGKWTFGTADDVVLMLDFDCDGVDNPVLVDPSGNVFVVDEWTDGARGRYVTTVRDVIDANVEHGQTCDTLVLSIADGRTRTPDLNGA